MRKLPVLMMMIPFLVLGGCGGGEGGGPVEPQPLDTPEAYVGRGWERFEGGDSSGAQADFQAALDLDENHGPALAGYGWAMLVAAPSDISMQSALDSFDAALARGETASYVTAGRAAARLALGQWSGASGDGAAVLQGEPGFIFQHRTSFTGVDLLLVMAFAQAASGDVEQALATANTIQQSGIDPGQSATWTVGGIAYPSYAGAVLAHLALLSENHAG